MTWVSRRLRGDPTPETARFDWRKYARGGLGWSGVGPGRLL